MKHIVGEVIRKNGVNVIIKMIKWTLNTKYKCKLKSSVNIMAHDEIGAEVGSTVKAVSCRPISKRKKFKIEAIL